MPQKAIMPDISTMTPSFEIVNHLFYAADDARNEARRGNDAGTILGIRRNRRRKSPKRNIAYCVEKFPYKVGQTHINNFECVRLHVRKELRTAEEHHRCNA